MIHFSGALQRADQPQGPFRPVPNNRSPMVDPAGAGQEFWRAWLPGVRSIGACGDQAVALHTDGTLWTWGDNRFGQLGLGVSTTNYPFGTNTPQRIERDTNWQSVMAGLRHTVALRADGSLWAWGANEHGQSGNGTFSTNNPPALNTPQQVGTNTNWGPPP